MEPTQKYQVFKALDLQISKDGRLKQQQHDRNLKYLESKKGMQMDHLAKHEYAPAHVLTPRAECSARKRSA